MKQQHSLSDTEISKNAQEPEQTQPSSDTVLKVRTHVRTGNGRDYVIYHDPNTLEAPNQPHVIVYQQP